MDARLFGHSINQEDLPHWATAVLGWLSCYLAVQNAYGKAGDAYRQILDKAMDGTLPYKAVNRRTGAVRMLTGPSVLYPLYEDLLDALKKET